MRIRKRAVASVAVLVASLPLLGPVARAEGAVAEAEAGTGAGRIMMRSGASGQRSVWLHASEARQVPFTVEVAGTYVLAVRYSNDNFGPLESVDVRVGGTAVGQFTAQDTGDWGSGWNNFLWSPGLSPVTLAAGAHQATTTVSGGDGYGVEIDAVRIERVIDSTPTNMASNPARSGLPSPLESDPGWGGGSSPWDILDGLRTYPSWEHGLAFTGGHTNGAGSGGWVQPCGERQATISFNSMAQFGKVVLWHHPDERHVPAAYRLDYWDGATWRPIAAVRSFGASRDSSAGYGSVSDEYTFPPVMASKVRYSFDNCGNTIDGVPLVHGWLYEFEVYG